MDLTVARSPLIGREGFLVIELDRFQGPLDLLLHLIRQQDLDIFQIPIAEITDQFLAAIQGIEADQLEGAGEFLEMAATLIRIKAQMLLPRHEGEEDQDPRAELVRRLLEYEQIREIASRLQASEAERGRRFGKGYVPPRPRPAPSDTPFETTWADVYEAALRIETPEHIDRRHRVTPRTVAMEDKVVLITKTLLEHARVEFSKLLEGFEEKMHGVMTFLAGLEMSRRREVALRQVAPFSELWLYRRSEEETAPPVEGRAQALEEPEVFRGVKRRPDFMKPEDPEPVDALSALLDGEPKPDEGPTMDEHPTMDPGALATTGAEPDRDQGETP